MNTATTISLVPHISEKSYALSSTGVYVFKVPMDANKLQVKAAVEEQFNVRVTDVKSQVRKGKLKRSARKRQTPSMGRRNDVKFMYVTLKSGDTIPVFEEMN